MSRKEAADRPTKENIVDLSKYLDQDVLVETAGNRKRTRHQDACFRVVRGVLKGFDALLNLVLDSTNEILNETGQTQSDGSMAKQRHLGLTVVKGSQINMVSPASGIEEIPNPFQFAE